MRVWLGLVFGTAVLTFASAADPVKPKIDEEALNTAWKKLEGKWKSLGVTTPDGGYQEYTRKHCNFDYSLLTRDAFAPIRDGKVLGHPDKFIIIDPTAKAPSLDWYDNAETLGPHRKCIYRFKDADTLQIVCHDYDWDKRPSDFDIRQRGKEYPIMFWFERVKDEEKKEPKK